MKTIVPTVTLPYTRDRIAASNIVNALNLLPLLPFLRGFLNSLALGSADRSAPVVKPSKPLRYYYWFEYPFWIEEKWMLQHAGSYERPYDPEKLAQIMAAKQRTELMGGKRRRKTEIIVYW